VGFVERSIEGAVTVLEEASLIFVFGAFMWRKVILLGQILGAFPALKN